MTTDAQTQAQAIADQMDAQRLISNVNASARVGERIVSPENPEITGEVIAVAHPGTVNIWNRETGAHSYALPYMVGDLAKQLVKAGPYRGKSQWVFRFNDLADDLQHPQQIERFVCYLNEGHQDAQRYAAMGFGHCPRTGMPSVAALEKHMSSSHKRAWATIQKEVEDKRRDEDRDFARANTIALQSLVERLAGGATAAPVAGVGGTVVPAPVEVEILDVAATTTDAATGWTDDTETAGSTYDITEVEPVVDEIRRQVGSLNERVNKHVVPGGVRVPCELCDYVQDGANMGGAKAKLRKHVREVHQAG